jgi:hypothetical protein
MFVFQVWLDASGCELLRDFDIDLEMVGGFQVFRGRQKHVKIPPELNDILRSSLVCISQRKEISIRLFLCCEREMMFA